MTKKIEFKKLMEDVTGGKDSNYREYEGKELYIHNIIISDKEKYEENGKYRPKLVAIHPDRNFLWIKSDKNMSIEKILEMALIKEGEVINAQGIFSTGDWLENHYLNLSNFEYVKKFYGRE
ncbi:MAG: hypothetical protein KKF74_00120 [Nanoarchaeota archaeon]|nr:hypothetical protein [Nanoarchaeota archaeon]